MTRLIDFHNHYYPPRYIEALERGPSAVRITHDEEGNPWLHYPGDYNIALRGTVQGGDAALGGAAIGVQHTSTALDTANGHTSRSLGKATRATGRSLKRAWNAVFGATK